MTIGLNTHANENLIAVPTDSDPSTLSQCIPMIEYINISPDSSIQIEVPVDATCAADLIKIMSKIWGFSSFNGHQEAAVDAIYKQNIVLLTCKLVEASPLFTNCQLFPNLE